MQLNKYDTSQRKKVEINKQRRTFYISRCILNKRYCFVESRNPRSTATLHSKARSTAEVAELVLPPC